MHSTGLSLVSFQILAAALWLSWRSEAEARAERVAVQEQLHPMWKIFHFLHDSVIIIFEEHCTNFEPLWFSGVKSDKRCAIDYLFLTYSWKHVQEYFSQSVVQPRSAIKSLVGLSVWVNKSLWCISNKEAYLLKCLLKVLLKSCGWREMPPACSRKHGLILTLIFSLNMFTPIVPTLILTELLQKVSQKGTLV